MGYLISKQYWADASTKNCVWLFQTFVNNHWHTEQVFLKCEEARNLGESRPYAYGKEGIGWRCYGVPCDGLMAEIIGKHLSQQSEER